MNTNNINKAIRFNSREVNQLKVYLQSKGITLTQLGRKMGCSDSFWTKALNGRNNISKSKYDYLCELHPEWKKPIANESPVVIQCTDKQVEEVNKAISSKYKIVNKPTYPEFNSDWPLQLAIAWLENFPGKDQ